jgi:hypothetical protein
MVDMPVDTPPFTAEWREGSESVVATVEDAVVRVVEREVAQEDHELEEGGGGGLSAMAF